MHTDNNNQTGLDEIVFESRNKEYGAYSLRKEYNKNTSKAVVFGLICLLLSAGTPFIMANFNKNGKTIIEDNPITFIDLKTEADELPPPPPPPPTPPPIENQAKFTTPLVVDDPVDSVEMGTNDQIKQNTRNDAVNIDIKDDKTKIEIIDTKKEEAKIFFAVEEMPEFPGGETELRKFIASNIRYPEIAKENGSQGKVYIFFVINAEGGVEQIEIKRSLDPFLDKEAIRVIQSMPKWSPGKQSGVPVKVAFTIPINFQLQ